MLAARIISALVRIGAQCTGMIELETPRTYASETAESVYAVAGLWAGARCFGALVDIFGKRNSIVTEERTKKKGKNR